MSTTKETALTKESRFTEFVPFGAEDKIKLSIEMVKSLIAVKTKSGATCSDTDAIKFIAMCQARRLNPFEGDAFLIGYDSKEKGPTYSLITAHQAFLKRAELHPEYNGMESGVIVKRDGNIVDLEGDFYLEGDEIMGGWAKVHFKNRLHPMSKRIRLQRFQKSFGVWQEDPAGMIVKCAEADALRSSFPTMLGGLYLREEMEQPETRVATPIFKNAAPVVEVKPEKHPGPALVDQVSALMKQDGIDETTLLEFLGAIGLAGEQESITQLGEDTLGMCVEQWPDFVKRIKEVQ